MNYQQLLKHCGVGFSVFTAPADGWSEDRIQKLRQETETLRQQLEDLGDSLTEKDLEIVKKLFPKLESAMQRLGCLVSRKYMEQDITPSYFSSDAIQHGLSNLQNGNYEF